jgi:hypothetical protein
VRKQIVRTDQAVLNNEGGVTEVGFRVQLLVRNHLLHDCKAVGISAGYRCFIRVRRLRLSNSLILVVDLCEFRVIGRSWRDGLCGLSDKRWRD